jgi:hypothetical protein
LTAHAHHGAGIVLPDGQRVKLDGFRWSYSERAQKRVPQPFPQTTTVRFAPVRLSRRESRGLRRMFAPRVCWKCYDGRTRSHNRRCTRRGRGWRAP